MLVYHVVTDRPMALGQRLRFDEGHCSGVCRRVQEKEAAVAAVYASPEQYRGVALEHHLAVALRELAMEEVRQEEYPDYPSRLRCLYASGTLAEAALALGGFWEAAERSAACYLEQLRDLTEREAGRRDREEATAS